MIKIEIHPNFSEWLNISLWGKLVDNAKSEAQALRIAKTIQKEHQAQGERVMIINHVEENN